MHESFFARSAALRPSKPKTGFHPNTRKPRVPGAPACWEQLRAGPAAQGQVSLKSSFGTAEAVP